MCIRDRYVPDFAREEDREYPAAENVNQGAMRGTAVHRVMECLDFAAIADIDTSDAGAVSAFVKQELDRMLSLIHILCTFSAIRFKTRGA